MNARIVVVGLSTCAVGMLKALALVDGEREARHVDQRAGHLSRFERRRGRGLPRAL